MRAGSIGITRPVRVYHDMPRRIVSERDSLAVRCVSWRRFLSRGRPPHDHVSSRYLLLCTPQILRLLFSATCDAWCLPRFYHSIVGCAFFVLATVCRFVLPGQCIRACGVPVRVVLCRSGGRPHALPPIAPIVERRIDRSGSVPRLWYASTCRQCFE